MYSRWFKELPQDIHGYERIVSTLCQKDVLVTYDGHPSLSSPNCQRVGKCLAQKELWGHHGFLGYPTTEDGALPDQFLFCCCIRVGQLYIVFKSTVTSRHLALLNQCSRLQHQLNKILVSTKCLAGKRDSHICYGLCISKSNLRHLCQIRQIILSSSSSSITFLFFYHLL